MTPAGACACADRVRILLLCSLCSQNSSRRELIRDGARENSTYQKNAGKIRHALGCVSHSKRGRRRIVFARGIATKQAWRNPASCNGFEKTLAAPKIRSAARPIDELRY